MTNADFWLAQIKAHAPQASIILVGTKSDKEQIFPIDIMRQFASERDINYIATSSKEGTNVNEAFLRLLKEIIMLAPDEMEEKKVDNLVIHEDKNRKGACC